MISFEEALATYARAIQPLSTESISIVDSAGRVLAAPVHSTTDLPRFDQSAVDGYAINAADAAIATESVRLIKRATQRRHTISSRTVVRGDAFTSGASATLESTRF